MSARFLLNASHLNKLGAFLRLADILPLGVVCTWGYFLPAVGTLQSNFVPGMLIASLTKVIGLASAARAEVVVAFYTPYTE